VSKNQDNLEPAPATVGAAITEAVKALTDALCAPFEGVTPIDGEGEAEYVARVLPVVAASIRERMETAEAEVAALKRQLRSQKGAATKARNRIEEIEEAAKPRKLGPVPRVQDEKGRDVTVDTLMTAIDSAEEIVLAFSDGKAELAGIRPRKVSPKAFRLTRGQLLFTDEPLEVFGPGGENAVSTLAGVALLVDGLQVGWSPMAMPIAIGAGQTVNLAGSVIFR
jgi:hypothetical protein